MHHSKFTTMHYYLLDANKILERTLNAKCPELRDFTTFSCLTQGNIQTITFIDRTDILQVDLFIRITRPGKTFLRYVRGFRALLSY